MLASAPVTASLWAPPVLSAALALFALQQLPAARAELRPPPPAPPNILLIVADDVGVDLLGCYAENYPTPALAPCTPTLDALAAGGVRFTNAWSNPSCSPSRAQIMTGKRTRHTGVGTLSNSGLDLQAMHGLQVWEDSLASLLSDHVSVALGKWHLSDPLQNGAGGMHPIQLGFQSFAGTLYGVEPAYDDWPKLYLPEGVQSLNHPVYATTDVTADALAAIASLPEPWMLHVGFAAIHSPFHCPEDHGFDVDECLTASCSDTWCADCTGALASPECQTFGAAACQARAMMQTVDAMVGKLLHAVDLETTLVVFVGDNGTPMQVTVPPFDAAHAKWTVYQGGVNVPLVIAGAGVSPGGLVHELVSLTDLFATFAEAAGVRAPADPRRDSVSLGQYLWPGGGGSPRTHVVAEHFEPNFVPDANGQPPPGYQASFVHRAVRNAEFKLLEVKEWDAQLGACVSSRELYRLADAAPQDPAAGPDPFESVDLMLVQGNWPPEVQAAHDELALLLDFVLEPLPSPCP